MQKNPASSAKVGKAHADSSQRRGGYAVVIVAAICATAWFTWGATADALIDFGRELYVPWQLAEGKSLYRDVAYFNGPFSPHFNAWAFRLFGTSVSTLAITNSIILVLIQLVLLRTFVRFFSVFSVAAACLVTTVVFGVGHLVPLGNYNFITPYSHEMTHGMLLAVLVLSLVCNRTKQANWRWLVVGILWGLAFLTKAEIFVAVTAMIGCSSILRVSTKRVLLSTATYQTVAIVAGGLIPVVGFWWLLSSETSMTEASVNVLGTWKHLIGSRVVQLPFYQLITGMDRPFENTIASAGALIAIGLSLAACYLFERDFAARGWVNLSAWTCIAISFLMGGCSTVLLHAHGFFLLGLIMLGGSLWKATIATNDEGFARFHACACWAAFAIMFLTKMFLHPRLSYYGFAMSMPVVMLGIVLALDWLPKAMFASGKGKRFVTALAAILLVDASIAFAQTCYRTRLKTVVLGSESSNLRGDSIRCDTLRGEVLAEALDFLSARIEAGKTLLVLPEGVTLNYLLRVETPTPHLNFMVPELEMYGEQNIVSQLKQSNCDYVVLIARDLREYGVKHFGQPGYGDRLLDWVDQNYTPVKSFGTWPTDDPKTDFGMQILKRN